MTTDSETMEQSKFCMDHIFDICPSFCVAWVVATNLEQNLDW